MYLSLSSAVDEQNLQTLEREEALHTSSHQGFHQPHREPPPAGVAPQYPAIQGLLKTSTTSRSAPSFSVFSQETSPLAADPRPHSQPYPQYPPRPQSRPPSTTDVIVPQPCTTDPSRSPHLGGPASRRISSMAQHGFNRSASVDSKLGSRPGEEDSIVGGGQETPPHVPTPPLRFPLATPALPGISSSIAKNLAGGGFISKVLLANADALCAAASPLLEQDIPLESYSEKCVMNNYFGIGLDAKITLEFQMKREEHPEKYRYVSLPKSIFIYSRLLIGKLCACLQSPLYRNDLKNLIFVWKERRILLFLILIILHSTPTMALVDEALRGMCDHCFLLWKFHKDSLCTQNISGNIDFYTDNSKYHYIILCDTLFFFLSYISAEL